MRIISGKFKGRKFDPPVSKWSTRPTMDSTREALFNVLAKQCDFETLKVLELFSGTSAVSLEFISRGCTDVTTVDAHFGCIQFSRKLQKELNLHGVWKLVKGDAVRYLEKLKEPCDLIFCDPPYDFPFYPRITKIVFENACLKPGGMLILEHDKTHNFVDHPYFTRERVYGSSHFSFFSRG